MNTSVRVQHEKLERFVSLVFQRLGMVAADVRITAKVLVMADLGESIRME